MKFGVFTDPHLSDRPDDAERLFSGSEKKIERCVDFFRKEKVDFTVCLGDLTDSGNGDLDRKKIIHLREQIERSGIPFYLCLGNHDLGAMRFSELVQLLPGAQKKGYGSFDAGECHFVILDSNYRADGKRYTINDMKWDDLWIDAAQMEWLADDLKAQKKPTVIMVHANLDPRAINGKRDAHVICNSRNVREILEKAGTVQLVLQGHCHKGALTLCGGITYLTLEALVERTNRVWALIVSYVPEYNSFEINVWNGEENDGGQG